MSRSVLDEWLPVYARERGSGPYLRLMPDDLLDVQARARRAQGLPYGERGPMMLRIAEDCGVSTRTLQRYLRLRTPCPGPRCLTWVRGGGLCTFCRGSFIRRGAHGDPRDLSEAGVDGANLSHLLPGVQR